MEHSFAKKCQNLQITKWAMTHPIRPLRSVGGQTKSGLKHIQHRKIKNIKQPMLYRKATQKMDTNYQFFYEATEDKLHI